MNTCPVHKTQFKLKEGVSTKTGKPYSFWTCGQKDGAGWCQERPPEPKTGDQMFDRSLDESDARQQQTKKDESIARAVALKAAVDLHHGETTDENVVIKTADTFLSWLTA